MSVQRKIRAYNIIKLTTEQQEENKMRYETKEWMIAVGVNPSTLERVERDMRTNSINHLMKQLEELDSVPAEQIEENLVSYLCSVARDDDNYEAAINAIQRTLSAVIGAVIMKKDG